MINEEKSSLIPSKSLSWLGFEFKHYEKIS